MKPYKVLAFFTKNVTIALYKVITKDMHCIAYLRFYRIHLERLYGETLTVYYSRKCSKNCLFFCRYI